MARLAGKTAIIIGAGQTPGDTIGNGRAMAMLFAREGAEVLCVDRDLARAEETVAAITAEGGKAWGHAADIVRADVSWKDGITGTLKIAHLAEAFGLNCEIHTTTMNYMDLVNLHVSCAIKNCEYFEYFVPEENYTLPMKGKLPIDEHGIIHVPQGPGVGAELDWDLIEKSCRSYRKLEYKG